MNTTTKDIIVIYHRADFDGLFCREIAKKFIGDRADYIGWDYGDLPPVIPAGVCSIYILDLSVPGLMADGRVIWIDHHKSAIETYGGWRPGYCIDGVAACRLTWQWFANMPGGPESYGQLPQKQAYLDRLVAEPLAVRLAGEYDIWDKRDPRADLFQHGLRSCDLTALWPRLLDDSEGGAGDQLVAELLAHGEGMAYAKRQGNADYIREFGFDLAFEGLRFLACPTLRCNSHLFTAGLRPEHDGCLAFGFTGREWKVSLYGVPGKPDIDFSAIAKRYGGGGHKQACGFKVETLPFSEEAAEVRSLKNKLLQADDLNEGALFKINEVMARAERAEARLAVLVEKQWIVMEMPGPAVGYAVYDSDRRKVKSQWFATPEQAIDDARKESGT